jgi:hypothetical protein
MDITRVRTILFAAAQRRMPRFEDRDTDGMKIEKLETYLLSSAHVRGDLEEARLWMQQTLRDLDLQWRAIEGWELHLDRKRAATKEQLRQAKRMVGPSEAAIDDAMEEAKWLIARLTEQINRLSHMGDDQVASRIYTLLAGS